ncbi:MAG: DoxX family membrane protein [Propionibacteriaceae bacterium]|nr:DoxX family membrane protein [Propionibacteriaceae bacterium]
MSDNQFAPQAPSPDAPAQDTTVEPTRLLDAAGHDVTDDAIRPVAGTASAPTVPLTTPLTAPEADLPPASEVFARLNPSTSPYAPPAPTVPDAPVTAPLTAAPLTAPVPAAADTLPDPAALQAEHEARDRLLGNVATVEDDTEVPPLTRHDNDKFVGSFGLFWLRIVTAAVLGIRGVQMLLHTSRTSDWLDTLSVRVPEPTIVAWALPIIMLIVAVLLVIGLLTRTAAVIVVLYAAAMLVFVEWGTGNPFSGAPVQGGFVGDFDLLLGFVGIALAFLGAGGWSLDGHRRLVKARRKLYN